jgi:hypothetical protein
MKLESSHYDNNDAYRFLVCSLVRSQMELKREQDEGVNVYLAHLLVLLTKPTYLEWALGYVSGYDTDVFNKAEQTEDRICHYLTYKFNADHLLTSLGIFQNLGKPHGGGRRFYEQTPEIYMGRGKAYYDLAAEYHHKIYRQRTTLEEILHKLAFYFEEYVRVLAYMRSTYFDFVQRISGEDFKRLLRQLKDDGSGSI